MTQDSKKPLGRILLRQRVVTQPQLDEALAEASATGTPLATRLTESGAISEIAALKALSEQSGFPGIDLSQVCIRLADLEVLPREIAERHKLLPVLVRDDRIFVAMAAPTEKKVIDELEFVTGKRVYPYIALSGPLTRVIGAAYEMKVRGETHYVGPQCPAEVQKKAGVASHPPEEMEPMPFPTRAPTPGPAPAPEPAPPRPKLPTRAPTLATEPPFGDDPASPARTVPFSFAESAAPSPLVVDDAIGRMAAADELNDSDFGDAEHSVVGRLPSGPAAREGQKTIFVVDDEPEIRTLLRRVFEDRNYRVLETDRGQVAMQMLKETLPDAIILDAMLPEVHGFDIARRMKGTERFGHIPIIMVSAVYRGWRYAEDLKTSYGVDDYIEKPFRVQDVVYAVEKAIERRKQASGPSSDSISGEAERLLASGIEAYRRGDVDRAIEELKEGTRIDPLAFRLHFHLGLLYGKTGRLYDAIQELETAIHIHGKHFATLKNLAILYQKAGLRNKAIEMWERALTVAPDDSTRQSIKEHLLGLL
jgi:DNA-binding response OmpR family regulator